MKKKNLIFPSSSFSSCAPQPPVMFKLGYFQISFVQKLLSFLLPMVCIHVCHVFQVGHTMPGRKRRNREGKRAANVVHKPDGQQMNETKDFKKTKTKTRLKAVFRPSRFDFVWSSIMNHGAVSSFHIVSLLNKPRSRSNSKRELLRLILTHKFSNRQSAEAYRESTASAEVLSGLNWFKVFLTNQEGWGAWCHWLLLIFSLYFRLFVDNYYY